MILQVANHFKTEVVKNFCSKIGLKQMLVLTDLYAVQTAVFLDITSIHKRISSSVVLLYNNLYILLIVWLKERD